MEDSRELQLDAKPAGRAGKSGSARSPELGIRRQVSDDWLLRLNASRGFRAPPLPEIAQSTTISYGSVIDPFDPVQPWPRPASISKAARSGMPAIRRGRRTAPGPGC
ncbi:MULTISPECIES: TonB-dependent receptor [unclassified Lysobacter]|uniref:TonB-dependent receptor n=1 Tax=unclassified Lysobacter TaxID=2635362 RepID=UPI001BE920EE|nr:MULTISPECIES: TonB-dependent receptor [unclassified Lysobacter]MBT2747024.1 TonB-dependent receptor [Lysobacter sp. ISL-42]MBT2750515.1 TonB-dependent receptor [Lysobacter sp. ISL-50]MBT2776361.1 TonB-dependent receptor [Lysobacter sp. ISL-54]MBT2780856.1 TonB-dependent receptor [Lysobacter sp. ISL-52]